MDKDELIDRYQRQVARLERDRMRLLQELRQAREAELRMRALAQDRHRQRPGGDPYVGRVEARYCANRR